MNLDQVKAAIKDTDTIYHVNWTCKLGRKAKESDADFLPDIDLANLLVEECDKPCDCKIGILRLTPEETQSDGFYLVPENMVLAKKMNSVDLESIWKKVSDAATNNPPYVDKILSEDDYKEWANEVGVKNNE